MRQDWVCFVATNVYGCTKRHLVLDDTNSLPRSFWALSHLPSPISHIFFNPHLYTPTIKRHGEFVSTFLGAATARAAGTQLGPQCRRVPNGDSLVDASGFPST